MKNVTGQKIKWSIDTKKNEFKNFNFSSVHKNNFPFFVIFQLLEHKKY